MAWVTDWVPKNEGEGDTLRCLLDAFGEPTGPDKWWSNHLDKPTKLRLMRQKGEDTTGIVRDTDLARIYDEAKRLAHVGRFRYVEEHK